MVRPCQRNKLPARPPPPRAAPRSDALGHDASVPLHRPGSFVKDIVYWAPFPGGPRAPPGGGARGDFSPGGGKRGPGIAPPPPPPGGTGAVNVPRGACNGATAIHPTHHAEPVLGPATGRTRGRGPPPSSLTRQGRINGASPPTLHSPAATMWHSRALRPTVRFRSPAA